MRYKNPLIIGVTGGIGSGQTTVCNFFEEWGCKVIHADDEAKKVIHKDKAVQSALRKEFGKDIFFKDGKLNTKRLAELAFKDETQTGKLNQIVHPRMVERLIEEMENARFSGKYPVIVIDAALIYEISIERNFDYIIVVTAPVRIRQQRTFLRNKLTRNEFNDRSDKQIPLDEKAKWADFVIENKTTLEDLKKNTEEVFKKLSGEPAKQVKLKNRPGVVN